MLFSKLRNPDTTYGPTAKGKYYMPNPAHGINSTHNIKHKWRLNENQEYSVFEFAEKPSKELFCLENDCYFSIIDNARVVLGTAGERLAKFPKPKNVSDPWHGYPVICDHTFNIPSDMLLDLMVEELIIDKTTRRRIERKRL